MSDEAVEAHLREFKRARGRELMERYGAHALGIGRKRVRGKKTGRLALLFYVPRKGEEMEPKIPPSFTFRPEGGGEEVRLPTDVVARPPCSRRERRRELAGKVPATQRALPGPHPPLER